MIGVDIDQVVQEKRRKQWREAQRRRRERLYRERGPIPLSQDPWAVYMRAYMRKYHKKAT